MIGLFPEQPRAHLRPMAWLSLLLAALLALQMLFLPFQFQTPWSPGAAQHVRLLSVTYAVAALGIGVDLARIGIHPWVGRTSRLLFVSALLVQGIARSTGRTPSGLLLLAVFFAVGLAATGLWPEREGPVFRGLYSLTATSLGAMVTGGIVPVPGTAALPLWLGPLFFAVGLLLCLGFIPVLRTRPAGWAPYLLTAAVLGLLGVIWWRSGNPAGASFSGVMALGSGVWGLFLRKPWQDRTPRFRRRILTMAIMLSVVPLYLMGTFAVYAVEMLEPTEGIEAVRRLAGTCLLLTAGIGLLAIVVSLSVTSRLAGRLAEVREVALALSARHFRARVRGDERDDEVAGLTATVNEMAATLERYSGELNRLLALTDAALAHLTGKDLLRELLWRVRDALSGDIAAILLLDKGGATLHVAETSNLEVPPGIRIPLGKGFAGSIAATAQPLVVPDLSRISVVTKHLRENARSAVGVPLISQGKLIGVVHVGSQEPNHFTPEDARVLQLAADRIAPAIAHAELFAAERQARLEVEEKTREIQQLNADLERRVAERTAELVMTNQELEAFSYSVSHDLRGPLRTIDGFSQALLEESADRLHPQEVDYLQRIQGGIRRMGQLIDALLQLSRVTRHEVRRVAVDLSAMARAIAGEIQQARPDHPVQVTVEDGMTVLGDPRLIRILLANLLDNAFKFTGKTAAPAIAVGQQMEDGGPVYYVLDNGVGFDKASAGKLFRPFERLHSTAEFEGTGIGLATVRRIVQLHGGRVWADGAVGEGAVVYFTLP